MNSNEPMLKPRLEARALLSALAVLGCAGADDDDSGVSNAGLDCADGAFYWDGVEFEDCEQCPDSEGCGFVISTVYDYPGGQQTVTSESVTATCDGQSQTIVDGDCASSERVDMPAEAMESSEPTGTLLFAGCLPGELPASDAGRLSCALVEIEPSDGRACSCNAAGREAVPAALAAAAREGLEAAQICSSTACDDFCACEITQATGAALETCQEDTGSLESGSGFCYVDPERGYGNEALVQECSAGERRLLRFADPPQPDSLVWTDCEP